MELVNLDYVRDNFYYDMPRPNEWLQWTEEQRRNFKEKIRGESIINFVAREQDKISARAIAKELYEEIICPLCYRLNPQHAIMDNGEGCKDCAEKEMYCK